MTTCRNYIQIANKYIEDVLKGKRIECRLVQLACERQKKDLARQRTKAFPYVFDEKKATSICKFVETLPHVKGELANTNLVLEPWQVFILTTVFGWYTDNMERRRFRNAYIEVARGNGKSALSSGVILYCAFADGEFGADCYSFATTRKQAGIVFNDARMMASMRPRLLKHFGVDVLAHSLYSPKTNSTVMAQSSEAGTQDGLNIHLGVVDELHAHPTRDLYDVVITGLGKRKRSLLWCITTAGTNVSGVCYEQHTYNQRVLEGEIEDDSQFGMIFTVDDPDRWFDLNEVRKANPNWGVSVDPSFIENSLHAALNAPAKINNFKTKHCDVWCNAGTAWLSMQRWMDAIDPTLDEADFKDDECFMGFDLGAKSDLTALSRVYRRENYDRGGYDYYFFNTYYLPEGAIARSNVSQYEGWVHDGWIKKNPGEMTDYTGIIQDILEIRKTREVTMIGFDPWKAKEVTDALLDEGAPLKEVPPSKKFFSEPAKLFEALLLDGRIHVQNDPVFMWNVSNVEAVPDIQGNILPQKAQTTNRNDNKIDGVMAAITALAVAVSNTDEGDMDDFIDNMVMA